MIRNFFITLIFFPVFLAAQDLPYAHRLVDTLTAPGMQGRGYVNDGDKKAAVFIAEEFRKFKLDSFNTGYFQSFGFPVNTFPGEMMVAIDNKILQPGADYIVDPSCGSINGTYTIIPVSDPPSNKDKHKVKHKFILVDKSKAPGKEESAALGKWIDDHYDAAGIIIVEEKKLTWSVAPIQRACPVIHILKNALPSNAKKISVKIDAELQAQHQTQNILGFIKGSMVPDSFLVFSAHYDHLGRMGQQTYFPGANDNASGTAMLLNLVEYYSRPENKPKYSMVFISFAGEEAGLLGSEFYTSHPLFSLTRIKFLLNMDLLGTGDDGMMVVNGDVFKPEFDILTKINDQHQYLKTIGKRGKAHNSDHYYFSEKGVPCFFFYTLGGISAYHDIYDLGSTLPFTDFEDVFRLIRDFETEISR